MTNQVVSKAKLLGLESGIMLLNFVFSGQAETNWLCSETWNICPHLNPQPSLKQCFEDRSAYCEATRLPTVPRLSFCTSVLALVMSAKRFHQPCKRFCSECCQTDASVEALEIAVNDEWCSELLPASWTDLLPLDHVLRTGRSWALWLKPDVNRFFVSHECPRDKLPTPHQHPSLHPPKF